MAAKMKIWNGTAWIFADANNADKLGGKLPTEYAGSVHGHAVADVTGLQTALDGKSSTNHSHAELAKYNAYKSGKDADGLFTTIEYKRPTDATVYMKSVLSNKDVNGNYTTNTWTYYAADGITATETIIWTISYDANKDITSTVRN